MSPFRGSMYGKEGVPAEDSEVAFVSNHEVSADWALRRGENSRAATRASLCFAVLSEASGVCCWAAGLLPLMSSSWGRGVVRGQTGSLS